MLAFMRIVSKSHGEIEVPDRVILAAAGRIYQARRKTRSGPKKVFHCCWCNRACEGRAALIEHQSACPESVCAQLGL